MVTRQRLRSLAVLLISVAVLPGVCGVADDPDRLVTVILNPQDGDAGPATIAGRILVTAQDGGILLEERNGRLHNLTPDDFSEVQTTDDLFTALNADELATELVGEFGSAFGIRESEHFILASSASDAWTEHCARLLEEVHQEYFRFFAGLELPMTPTDRPLAVILFRSQEELQTHAKREHPEVSFEDVPGYYSARFNRMYATDISINPARSSRELQRLLRSNPRHTETIVHETVHLLGYNTGLHTRQADNPLWFTEGLAAYFEPVSGRGRLLWNGPGRANAVYLNHLRSAGAKKQLPMRLTSLVQDNLAFQDSAADAYASSWTLVYGLLRRHRGAFVEITRGLQQRSPLVEVEASDELSQFSDAVGMPLEQLETQCASTVRRLRIPSRRR